MINVMIYILVSRLLVFPSLPPSIEVTAYIMHKSTPTLVLYYDVTTASARRKGRGGRESKRELDANGVSANGKRSER
jgi:hypothetical protein